MPWFVQIKDLFWCNFFYMIFMTSVQSWLQIWQRFFFSQITAMNSCQFLLHLEPLFRALCSNFYPIFLPFSFFLRSEKAFFPFPYTNNYYPFVICNPCNLCLQCGDQTLEPFWCSLKAQHLNKWLPCNCDIERAMIITSHA